ncbi:MAG: hypothetical protein H0W84_11545, partial [Bacteroidetes bacterium]|nr:hypothetical protein [Bacteroidota bacterium]
MKTQLLKYVSLLSLYFVLFLSNAFAQNYYVSALTGSDSNTGLSTTTAFATIQKGADMVSAGGTVFIMNGRYNRTTYGSVLELTKSGNAGGYITFKAYQGHTPKISASGSSWNAIIINGSYVILDGLELEGNNANLTLAGAVKAFDDNVAGTAPPNAAYNTNGISIGSGANPHHVTIRNCKVHDFPGGGIGGGGCDYIT